MRSASSRQAEVKLAGLKVALVRLQGDPFQAMAIIGGSPERARSLMAADEHEITTTLDALQREGPPPALRAVTKPLRANFAADRADPPDRRGSDRSLRASTQRSSHCSRPPGTTSRAADVRLAAAGRQYRERAEREQTQATLGSAAAILFLFGAFALVFRRSFRARSAAERLASENARLAATNRHEARTDALTGLRNRRALIDDLNAGAGGERVLALFDLDGFKHYNDTFGHPAGDGLLVRLGERLQAAVSGLGIAYRMGGDEFCVLSYGSEFETTAVVALAADALTETGDAFLIGCSYGSAVIPREASSPEAALRLADQRMYEHKAGRASASRQSSDVLLKVLSERNSDLREHGTGVASMAMQIAEQLALPASEVKTWGWRPSCTMSARPRSPTRSSTSPGR